MCCWKISSVLALFSFWISDDYRQYSYSFFRFSLDIFLFDSPLINSQVKCTFTDDSIEHAFLSLLWCRVHRSPCSGLESPFS